MLVSQSHGGLFGVFGACISSICVSFFRISGTGGGSGGAGGGTSALRRCSASGTSGSIWIPPANKPVIPVGQKMRGHVGCHDELSRCVSI